MGFLLRNKFAVLAALALAVTAALFGHWRLSSWRAMEEVQAAAETLRGSGWRVEIGEVAAAGAPNRIDLALEEVSLASPDGRWSLATSALMTRALSYRDDYLAFLAPEPLKIDTPLGGASTSSPKAAASLVFEEDRLTRLSVALPDLSLSRPDGGITRHRDSELHLRREPAEAAPDYRIYVAIAGDGDAPSATLDGRIGFDAPLSRAPLSAGAPTELLLDPGLSLKWRDAELRVSRRLERSGGGWRGLLHVESDEAAAAIGHLEALGLLTADIAARLRARVSAADRLAGVLAVSPDTVILRDVGPDDILLWSAQRQ